MYVCMLHIDKVRSHCSPRCSEVCVCLTCVGTAAGAVSGYEGTSPPGTHCKE